MNKKYALFITLLVIYLAAMIAFVTFHIGGESYDMLDIAVNAFIVASVVAAGMWALRFFGWKSSQGRTALFLSFSLACWLAADLLWATLYKDVGVTIADGFYMVAYILMFIGVLFGAQTINPNYYRNRRLILAMTFVIFAACALYFTLVPGVWDPESSFIENAVVAGYAVGDMIIIVPAIYIVWLVARGRMSRPWILIIIAVMLNFLGDMHYNLNTDDYYTGSFVDIIWYAAYILIGGGLYLMRFESESIVSQTTAKFAKKK